MGVVGHLVLSDAQSDHSRAALAEDQSNPQQNDQHAALPGSETENNYI